MKKSLLISAVMALSTNFAFAQVVKITSSIQPLPVALNSPSPSSSSSSSLPPLSQQLSLDQKIGDTSKGGKAANEFFGAQVQVPVNAGDKLSLVQNLKVSQTIGNTSTGGRATNSATVIQAQVPLSFSNP